MERVTHILQVLWHNIAYELSTLTVWAIVAYNHLVLNVTVAPAPTVADLLPYMSFFSIALASIASVLTIIKILKDLKK